MNKEKILEIARRYTSPEAESRILFGADGNATGGTVAMTYWNFCEEELIAFAKSVIEADRESSDEPMAWLTLGRDMGSNRDIVTFSRSALIPSIPLYTRPAPARKPLSDEDIEDVIESQCWAYGFDANSIPFARAIEKKIWGKAHSIGETE